jgi:hypothetical protein
VSNALDLRAATQQVAPVMNPSSSKIVWPYVAAGVVTLLGLAGAFALFYATVTGFAGSIVRVVAPGATDVSLAQAGSYTVYLERDTSHGENPYRIDETMPGLGCTLVSADGEPVALAASSTVTTYRINGRSGKSLLVFAIDKPGRYRFAARYDDGRAGPAVDMAIAPSVQTMTARAFPALGVTFASFFVSVGLIVLGYRRNKRIQASPSADGLTA